MSTSSVASAQPRLTARSFRALGTTATVVVPNPSKAHEAKQILRTESEAIDRACSRFRLDSEPAHLHANAGHDVDQVVTIHRGGLASSSTEVRTWKMESEQVHHIVDPATERSSAPRLVSAAGASCVDANALSTAAVVWGDQAIERLRPFDRAVRLLRHDGEVFTAGGWPEAGRP